MEIMLKEWNKKHKKNEIMLLATKWMDLEGVKLN